MSDDPKTLVKQGIKARKAGQKTQAREFFEQALTLDERNEDAWLWLSTAVDTPEEQEICLENVLAINPHNASAQKGIRAVRQKLAGSSSPPPPPVPTPTPTNDAPQPWYQDEPQAVQMPGSWDEDDDENEDEDGAHTPGFEFVPEPLGAGDEAEGGFFFASTGAAAAGAKRRPAGEGAGGIHFEKAQASDLPGLIDLPRAWLAALVFNGKRAYERELEASTVGRTVINVIMASIISTLVLLIGMLVGLEALVNMLGIGIRGPGGLGGIATGINASLEIAVILAPFQVIFFYAIAFGMSIAGYLTGGSGTFYDLSHLFSIAYAATTILFSFLSLIFLFIIPALLFNMSPNVQRVFESILPIISGAIGLYVLLVWGHAIGTAKQTGTLMGAVTAFIGFLIAVFLVLPPTIFLLAKIMSM